MHHLIDKKKKIYFYIIFLFFLTSIFNFEIKTKLSKIFSIKNILYEKKGLDIKIDKFFNKSIFTIDEKEIRTLIDNYPIVSSFQINKIYPNTLKINLEKTKALAKIYINGDQFYIGENKKIFKSKTLQVEVPIIKGFVEIDEINNLFKILNKTLFKNWHNIEYLVYHPSTRWDIYLKNEIIIKLPIELKLDVISSVDKIVNDGNLKKKIIDLRIKNQVIISDE